MWSWNRPNSGETNRNITLTLKGKFGDDFLLSRQLKYRPSLQGYSSTHKCMITDSWESRLYAEPHLLATFLSPTIFHSKEPIPSPEEQQSPLKTWFYSSRTYQDKLGYDHRQAHRIGGGRCPSSVRLPIVLQRRTQLVFSLGDIQSRRGRCQLHSADVIYTAMLVLSEKPLLMILGIE